MYDVLTIGTASRDVFLQSHLFRPVFDTHFLGTKDFPTGKAECFAFGGKIEVPAPIFTIGGGAVNTAVTFARQGLDTATMCTIGKDEAGKAIINALKHESIKSIISYAKNIGTSYSTILLSDIGERTILVYPGASHNLGRARKIETRAVYVAPGAMPHKPLLRLLKRCRSAGSLIVMNPSGHYIKLGMKVMGRFFELLDIVIMNREEAASLTGIAYQEERDILQRLGEIFHGIVVMTDGAKGSSVIYKKRLFRTGIFSNGKIVDRTGAGDAFGSGFVAMLIKIKKHAIIKTGNQDSVMEPFSDVEIQDAMRLASANATSVVEVIGATSGILTKAQFDYERWRNFLITVEPLESYGGK